MFPHTITAFREYKAFSPEQPWSVVELRFATESFSPPHYAETIEILICDNVAGEFTVGRRSFKLQGRQVFFVAPSVIHYAHYQPYDGYVWVLKFHPEILKQYIDLEQIMRTQGYGFADIPIDLPLFSETHALAELLQDQNAPLCTRLAGILDLFARYIAYIGGQKTAAPLENDPFLYKVITWTEAHFAEKFSIDEIAEKMGYSKSYFCNKFKKASGVPYVEYLISVRIAYACRLLQQGLSVGEVCEQCGFSGTSYFIKRFREITKLTPKQYTQKFAGK